MKTLNDLLCDVCDMARDLEGYRGKLGEFAYSMETVDQWHADGMRQRARRIAADAVEADMPDHDIEALFLALTFVCSTDPYAAKEVAGRFMSAVRRLRAVKAIKAHPRRYSFDSLIEALERGKQTAKQWSFAVRLAAEVGVALPA